MVLPYYCVFQNGQADEREAAAFKLHDSRAEFEARPRVFTTFVAQKSDGGYAVRAADLHVERLVRDAAVFGIIDGAQREQEESHIGKLLGMLLSRLQDAPAIVRLVLSQNGLEMFADTYKPRWAPGASIALASYRAARPWPEQKTTATEVSRASCDYAFTLGAREALLVDDSGFITEGSWSNFFWTDAEGNLFTRQDGVLPGITRRLVLESYPVKFRTVKLEEFFETASEAFITLSTQGIVPVARIDRWTARTGILNERLRRA